MVNLDEILIEKLNERYDERTVKDDLIEIAKEDFNVFDLNESFTVIALEYDTKEERSFSINLVEDDVTIIGYTLHLLWDNVIKVIVAIGDVFNSVHCQYKIEKCFFILYYNSFDNSISKPYDYEISFSFLYEID